MQEGGSNILKRYEMLWWIRKPRRPRASLHLLGSSSWLGRQIFILEIKGSSPLPSTLWGDSRAVKWG